MGTLIYAPATLIGLMINEAVNPNKHHRQTNARCPFSLSDKIPIIITPGTAAISKIPTNHLEKDGVNPFVGK